MAKKKPVKVERSNIKFTQLPEKRLVRCDVSDGYFGIVKWTFFVPLSTHDKYGFIPVEIVRSRMLHDFNIELGHYSSISAIEQ